MGVVVWLGSEPPEPSLRWLGEAENNSEKELLRQELAEEKQKLSTGEKVLIASLALNVVTFAWSVWQWRAGR